MWMYSGPSCTDHPFFTELDSMKINTWIWGILAHGADQNFGSDLVPLREGVDSPSMSLFELTSVCLYQFLLLNTYTFLCRILGTCTSPHGGHPT
jgi:hypothetical protein